MSMEINFFLIVNRKIVRKKKFINEIIDVI